MLDFMASDYTKHTFAIGVLNESINNFTYELRFSNSPRSKDNFIKWKDWHTEVFFKDFNCYNPIILNLFIYIFFFFQIKFIFPSLEPMGPRDKSSHFGGTPGNPNQTYSQDT